MRGTKKVINVVVRDENEKLVYYWNLEQGVDVEAFEEKALDSIHQIDSIAGKPERALHTEATEITVYC